MKAAQATRTQPLPALKRAAQLLAALSCLLASSAALAIQPAGGPPDPPGTVASDREEPVTGADAPDASVEDRNWLARGSEDESSFVATPSSRGTGFTLLALLLVVGLGGGALWLQRRKRKASPVGTLESRLTLLSSTRVGPKAYAVSAEVNGRLLLLGVTDHSVTHLGWLDPPELEAAVPAEESESEAPPAVADELPDDYPGSSLRAAALQASQLTTSHNLMRFQEVLRGAVPEQPQSLRAPRMPAPKPEALGRSILPLGSDAAMTLAALTSDVLRSEPAPARSVAPASLRRKRQRRQELTSKAPKAAAKAEPVEAASNALEGQVAGLRALKNG
jgi:flagellar biogenesis protein FliO